jgi:MoaA/NifB/PqqE/SkfB family radical SAM enzyme
MKIKQKISLGCSLLKTILFEKKKPIFVGWAITNRCNLHCLYCNAGRGNLPELDTYQVTDMIKILRRSGTRILRLTGGEPLLREDIATIVNYSHSLGLFNALSTNGILFPDRIKEIKQLDSVAISLEGPESIHDTIRGAGSHKKALLALEKARGRNIALTIATVLTSLNLECIEYLLKIAQTFNAKIFFQPADKMVLFSHELNPICPDPDDYKIAVANLMELKHKNKYIGNSMAGLKYLRNWPSKTDIHCAAAKTICRIDSQGNLHPCSRFGQKNKGLSICKKEFKHCFEMLISPICGNCWCSSLVELNLLSGFNINAIVNCIKI